MDPQTDQVPSRKRKARSSDVWQHYTLGDESISCDTCGKTCNISTSTYSLRYHLSKIHNFTGQETASASATPPFSPAKAEELLAKFISDNCLALRIVEDDSFREFIHYLQPNWNVCDRRRLTNVLLPQMKAIVQSQIKDKLKEIKYVSISLDSWTSLANRSYLALTVHGISKAFEFQSFLLDIVAIRKSETGEHIAELVKEILEEWQFPLENVVAGTSDGAANCKKAIKTNLELMWVYCVAHALNRSVRVGLEISEIKPILKKAKAICKFFRNSPKASKLLEEQQKRLELSTKKLVIDNKTRWGSAYKMVLRMLASRPAISSSLATITGTKRPPPEDLLAYDWNLLNDLAAVLKPIDDATTFVSQEKYPGMSYVTPVMHRLLSHHLSPGEYPVTPVELLKNKIYEDLSGRWKTLAENVPMALLMSVYLDPCLKDFSFVEDEDKRKDLLEKAESMLERLLMHPDATLSQGDLLESPQLSPEEQWSQQEKWDNLLGPLAQGSYAQHRRVHEELEKYKRRNSCEFMSGGQVNDPLLWWKVRQAKYPKLSKVARRFLCVIATSVPCERVFSKSGWIVNKRRTLLSD